MAQNGEGEVSTVFVVGFPPDVHPRELDNLCRFFPGFVSCKVTTTKGTSLFALFDRPDNAYYAIGALNGQTFDRSQPGEALKAQMARSNMRAATAAPVMATAPAMLRAQRPLGPMAPAYDWQPPPPMVPHPLGLHVEGPPLKRPRIPEDPSNVDTVASVGAKEAGFDEANLRAFFECLPGFLEFKGNARMGGGFAKFASAAFALQAVEASILEGVPCEIAKSSMGATQHGGGPGPGGGGAAAAAIRAAPRIVPSVAARRAPAAAAFAPFAPFAPAAGAGGLKRPRIPEDPSQVDTVASVGAREAGYDEEALHVFYQQLPGFIVFKGNARMGGGFAKFDSHASATEAVAAAKANGIPAEIARSSMSQA